MTSRIEYWKFLAKKVADDSDHDTAKRGGVLEAGLDEISDTLQSMIACTGGSEHWNGCTEKALKKIERVLGDA